jgi:hypothetical protein
MINKNQEGATIKGNVFTRLLKRVYYNYVFEKKEKNSSSHDTE